MKTWREFISDAKYYLENHDSTEPDDDIHIIKKFGRDFLEIRDSFFNIPYIQNETRMKLYSAAYKKYKAESSGH
jgi:hypothetical protein